MVLVYHGPALVRNLEGISIGRNEMIVGNHGEERAKRPTRIRYGFVGEKYFVNLLPLFCICLSRVRFPSALYLVFHFSCHAVYLFVRLCLTSLLAHIVSLKRCLRLKDRLAPWTLFNEMVLVEMGSVVQFKIEQCGLGGED